jgi:hypothetical protein
MQKTYCHGQGAPAFADVMSQHAKPQLSDGSLFGYKNKTSFNAQFIAADLEFHSPGNPIELLSRRIIDTGDQGIREALIKMGWTPPPDRKERGTGRTTRQILEAPRDAIFVCPNVEVGYSQRIAHRVGRPDIKFVPPNWIGERLVSHGGGKPVVLDHATQLSESQGAYLASYRKRFPAKG